MGPAVSLGTSAFNSRIFASSATAMLTAETGAVSASLLWHYSEYWRERVAASRQHQNGRPLRNAVPCRAGIQGVAAGGAGILSHRHVSEGSTLLGGWAAWFEAEQEDGTVQKPPPPQLLFGCHRLTAGPTYNCSYYYNNNNYYYYDLSYDCCCYCCCCCCCFCWSGGAGGRFWLGCGSRRLCDGHRQQRRRGSWSWREVWFLKEKKRWSSS